MKHDEFRKTRKKRKKDAGINARVGFFIGIVVAVFGVLIYGMYDLQMIKGEDYASQTGTIDLSEENLDETLSELQEAMRILNQAIIQSALGEAQTIGATTISFTVKAITSEDLLKFADEVNNYQKTENGKTIQIQHDVVNPRPYSRMYQLTGTKGFANKYPRQGYAFDPEQLAGDSIPDHENLNSHSFISDEQMAALLETYKHPILREIGEKAKEVGGHGGMDYVMDYRLIYCLNNGLPLDMDVYDLAEWSAIQPLSALSIENGSAPVEVPDFTRGAWNKVKGYSHAGVKGEAPYE